MNKGRLFAPFITLIAVAVSLFIMLNGDYSLKDVAIRLLIVLIVFYLISSSIQKRVGKFVAENEEKLREEAEREGAVIEKEAPAEEGAEASEGLPPLTGAMPTRPFESENENETFRVPE